MSTTSLFFTFFLLINRNIDNGETMSYSEYKLFLQLQEKYEFQLESNYDVSESKRKITQQCKKVDEGPHHNYYRNYTNKEPKGKDPKESIAQGKLFSSSQLRIKKTIRALTKQQISYKRIAVEKDYGINIEFESELDADPSEEFEIAEEELEESVSVHSDDGDEMSAGLEGKEGEEGEEGEDERDEGDGESQIDEEEKILIEEFLEENGEAAVQGDTFTNISFFENDIESMLESEKKIDFGNFTMDERMKYYKELLIKELGVDFGLG